MALWAAQSKASLPYRRGQCERRQHRPATPRGDPQKVSTRSFFHISTAIQTADAQTILNAASARMLRVSFGVM